MTRSNAWFVGFFFINIFLLDMPVFAQNNSEDQLVLYVVRHAEKDTGNNPLLSAKGKERAGALHRELQNRPLDLILVSQFKRTGMTGDSVRLYRNIETRSYKADATGDDLFNLIAALNGKYKHILVIGHSNTVPAIVRRAGAIDYTVSALPDYVYDHLFTISLGDGKIQWKLEKFGAPSVPDKAESKMQISQ